MNYDFVSMLVQDARLGLLSVLWWGVPTALLVVLWEFFFIDLRQRVWDARNQT